MAQLSDSVSADDPRARTSAVVDSSAQEEGQAQLVSPTRRLGSRALLAFSALIVAATSIVYFAWWIEAGRVTNPWLLLGLAGAFFYICAQVYGACFVYMRMKLPPALKQVGGHTVDVFIPVFDEADFLVEEALAAAASLTYPHTTYLLDDRHDDRLKILAQRYGAVYLRRGDRRGAKAGNVNAALRRSKGELVAIFDVDHVPDRDFLEHVVGYFTDPEVAFVQAAVGFRNENESWTARATAEQCEDAYGPTSMGMYGCDAAPVWGSHCTFRRTALESIGGHGIGLAEDLVTSLKLHAAGWKSVFVPELKARGLVPSDFDALNKQQFKWACGVFDVLTKLYPQLARRLTFSQNIAYLVRCTYYLIGPLFLVHALFTASIIAVGSDLGRYALTQYLLCSVPLVAAILLSRRAALARWVGQRGRLIRWRGYLQAFCLWPVYCTAFVCALLQLRVPHIATPKLRAGHRWPWWALPHAALFLILAGASAWRIHIGIAYHDILPLVFAALLIVVQAGAVVGETRR